MLNGTFYDLDIFNGTLKIIFLIKYIVTNSKEVLNKKYKTME